jgi:hypothetical protein
MGDLDVGPSTNTASSPARLVGTAPDRAPKKGL